MAATTEVTLHTFERVCDIVKGPERMLMPIAGYQDKPLVSLEEAVAPLVHQLPHIKTYAHTAKSRCNTKSDDDLTVDERASIMLYTMEWTPREQCLYVVLNDTLRSADREKLMPWFLYLKLILTALFKLPSLSCCVYRGVKRNLGSEYSKEEKFIWWAFSSCTLSEKTLGKEQFLGNTGARTLFRIECAGGKDISRYSYYKTEEEILLLPARQFEVVFSLPLGDDAHMVELKEIESTFLIPPDGSKTSPIGKNFTIEIFSLILKRMITSYYHNQLKTK